jgi:type II secretory pathway pseudopilin PulG
MKEEKNKSFTILEVLVAISIFTVGILAVWTLVQQPLAFSKNLSQKLIAVYLAQEGLEIVRNIRDTNLLNKCYKNFNINWNDGLGEGDWEVQYDSDSLSRYSDQTLNIEDRTGFYGYREGNSTNFKRKISIKNIEIQPPQAPIQIKGIKVTVTVYYNEKEIYSLQEYLFDLYEAVKDKAGLCPTEQPPTSSEEILL